MAGITGFVINGKKVIIDSFTGLDNISHKYFQSPYLILLIIPIVIILYYFIFKDVFNLKYDTVQLEKANKRRKLMIVTRLFVILLLLISLAGPFIEKLTAVQGDPKVKLLIDNSTSMQLFDQSSLPRLKSELEKKIPLEVYYISAGENSNIAEGIISNMKRFDQVLVFTDGNNHGNVGMGDAVLRAVNLGSSINAIRLRSVRYDASVSILGPDKTTSSAEEDYVINIKKSQDKSVKLKVDIDGAEVINKDTIENQIVLKERFSDGYHTIHAVIESSDFFMNNNDFFKSVKVVPKPRVILLTSSGEELKKLFEPLYDVDVVDKLPDSADGLKPYTSIIVDNIDAKQLDDSINLLADYLSEGNGLFVIGGGNSFDSGGYKNSRFEQLLPVYVSKAGKKRGEVNVVIVVDKSDSTGHVFGNGTKVDVEKSLAINMLKSLSLVNNVGVVAFDSQAYLVSDIKPMLEQQNLPDTIARIIYSGNTHISQGLIKAIELLDSRGGSKNIILISDGRNQDDVEALQAATDASSKGIRIYTVGVGDDTYVENMQAIADIGNGAYFQPTETDKIKILFGDTESSGEKKAWALAPIDKNHFITQGLDVKATIYGFNQIIPKSSAKLLMSTDVGDPIVSAWRLGLGRVVVLGTDYNLWGFELLGEQGSSLLTRSNNWAIGDPERKNNNFILISDGRVNEPIDVTVKSDVQPKSKDIALYKVDENIYRGQIVISKTGYNKLFDSVFGVNYKSEYQDVGYNSDLEKDVFATGGKVFNDDQVDDIVKYVKQRSRRDVIMRKSYSWIFALLALLVYLCEVGYRRLTSRKYL